MIGWPAKSAFGRMFRRVDVGEIQKIYDAVL